jgi:hypothetical protein
MMVIKLVAGKIYFRHINIWIILSYNEMVHGITCISYVSLTHKKYMNDIITMIYGAIYTLSFSHINKNIHAYKQNQQDDELDLVSSLTPPP